MRSSSSARVQGGGGGGGDESKVVVIRGGERSSEAGGGTRRRRRGLTVPKLIRVSKVVLLTTVHLTRTLLESLERVGVVPSRK